jgi:hypothetical protein
MIEALVFFVTMILCAVIVTATLVGITLNDIILIRQQHQYKKHPYAKRWRHRPLISITGSSWQHVAYRKIEYIKIGQEPKGELVIHATNSTHLDKETISQVIWQFNAQPKLTQVTLASHLLPPATFTQLAKNYIHIASDIFRRSRAGIGIHSTANMQTITRRTSISPSPLQLYWNGLYQFMAAVSAVLIPVTITYVIYIAFATRQPDMLAVVLGSFAIFMTASIWVHETATLKQKIFYSLLLPVTPGIFYLASFVRLLKVLANVVKAIFHRRISLFVRVKDILRVVE